MKASFALPPSFGGFRLAFGSLPWLPWLHRLHRLCWLPLLPLLPVLPQLHRLHQLHRLPLDALALARMPLRVAAQ